MQSWTFHRAGWCVHGQLSSCSLSRRCNFHRCPSPLRAERLSDGIMFQMCPNFVGLVLAGFSRWCSTFPERIPPNSCVVNAQDKLPPNYETVTPIKTWQCYTFDHEILTRAAFSADKPLSLMQSEWLALQQSPSSRARLVAFRCPTSCGCCLYMQLV